MQKRMKQILSGAAGATALLAGCVPQSPPVQDIIPVEEAIVPAQETFQIQEYAMNQEEEAWQEAYEALSHIEGSFSFDQETVTPADDLFNLFGTVVTGMCAKPYFETANQNPDYYVNIKGNMEHSTRVNLGEKKAERRIMLCACATGPATANAEVTGVRVADLLPLSELEQGINTITVRGADGYGLAMPLSYVLEKEAMIVYKVNGQNVPSGTQFFVPETVAKYFTRDVVDIELSALEAPPEVDQREDALRAEVAIMNYADGVECKLGDEIAFEGYADDCGDAIVAVEFSLDHGESWTSYATEGAKADRWVFWRFAFTPKEAGAFLLSVRARTASGNVSPLAANVVFHVTANKV